MAKPPDHVIAMAVERAMLSPCAKSKRGVVIYEPRPDPEDDMVTIVATGHNGPPRPMRCDGSAECRRDCPKICMHAEERAIVAINKDEWQRFGADGFDLRHLDLVHVKAEAGQLVPGGGPSCWQCSRTILDELIGGVWLYELTKLPPACVGCNGYGCNSCKPFDGPTVGMWRRYTAEEFHRITLKAQKDHPLHAAT